MFVVKGTSLIPSRQYSVQRFLHSFLFYPHSISTPPSSFSFQSYFLFFNCFILHFYTRTAVDTYSLRLPIFNSSTGLTQFNCRIQGHLFPHHWIIKASNASFFKAFRQSNVVKIAQTFAFGRKKANQGGLPGRTTFSSKVLILGERLLYLCSLS